jgi:tRNA uridine 5-carboxymethylaminomethyl modification enzyme
LRQDNADLRLTPLAAKIGLVDGLRQKRTEEKAQVLADAISWILRTNHEGIKLDQWFRRVENTWSLLPDTMRSLYPESLWPLIETEVKYAGHIDRQQAQIDRLARQEDKLIPAWVDYSAIRGMKTEAKMRLQQIQPRTLGQAGRISGITPADMALLAIWMEKGQTQQNPSSTH